MSNNELMKELGNRMEEQGFRWRMVSVEHVEELMEEILQRKSSGEIAEEVYREYMTGFETSTAEELPGARSIIAAASPQPQYQVGFTRDGEVYYFTIPPTYLHHTDQEVASVLKSVLEPSAYRFSRAWLPEKLLTVRSGLGRYGRNNITYIEGMGSFYRPRAYYTDLPCLEDHWQPVAVMDICKNCNICIDGCLPGALSRERFIVQADKCITFFSEIDIPWPQWVESCWDRDSKCLIGCMKCQLNCPKNRENKDRVQCLEVFSQQETSILLEEKERARLPVDLLEKLERLYLAEYIPILSRNLNILFQTA
jgi:epoxyqueuosine reductase